jgi:hypothetical protein
MQKTKKAKTQKNKKATKQKRKNAKKQKSYTVNDGGVDAAGDELGAHSHREDGEA